MATRSTWLPNAEGKSLKYLRVSHYRVLRIPGVGNVPPGSVGRNSTILFFNVGNLEGYQGSTCCWTVLPWQAGRGVAIALVGIGGRQQDVAHYQQKAHQLEIAEHCRIFGPRSVNDVGAYLARADFCCRRELPVTTLR